jgi:hypothetical protein
VSLKAVVTVGKFSCACAYVRALKKLMVLQSSSVSESAVQVQDLVQDKRKLYTKWLPSLEHAELLTPVYPNMVGETQQTTNMNHFAGSVSADV